MMWTFAGAACLLAGGVFFLSHRRGGARFPVLQDAAPYYFSAGLLSAMFAVDDMYLVHEAVGPHFGVEEKYVLAAYALSAALFVACFFRRILSFSPFFFLAAIALLAGSMAVDVANDLFGLGASYEVEDSAKFLGIAAWAAYFFRSACRELAALSEGPKP